MTFSCPFGRYWYISLLIGASSAGDMFQKEIGELFNVFGIADILIAGLDADGSFHDVSLGQVLQRSRQANLKLNKEKYLFG